MFWQAVLSASVLATRAQAGYQAISMDGLLPGDLEKRIEYFGEHQAAHIITKRQTGGVVMNSNGTINMTAWDATANEKCTQALLKLPSATNPTGTCVCYNLPALNNATGTFEADLRLYQLSTPTGDFAGVPQSNIQVSLTYQGASVAPIQSSAATQRISARQNQSTSNGQLRLLQTYMFAGQIDQNRMVSPMTMASIEALVMPVVTLSALNPTGQTVATNVSSNEAAFVAGVFSESTVMSEFSVANMAVDRSLELLANGTIAFVLPGVSLMIFPFGLIVTGIWTVGLCGAIAFGTFNRIGFRDQFKRRSQYAGKTTMGRI